MAMLADTVELVIGVDTHKHTHTAAVVVAATGAVIQQVTVPAAPAGYQQLLKRRVSSQASGCGRLRHRWLRRRADPLPPWSGRAGGELDRPKRTARRHGARSDALDAIRAAREALGRDQLAQPRAAGHRAALSVRLAAPRSAVQSATDGQRHLHALVVAAPDTLRSRLRDLTTPRLVSWSSPSSVEVARFDSVLSQLERRGRGTTRRIHPSSAARSWTWSRPAGRSPRSPRRWASATSRSTLAPPGADRPRPEPGLSTGGEGRAGRGQAGSLSWRPSCAIGARSSWSEGWCPQKAVPGHRGDGRRGHPGRGGLPGLGRVDIRLLRLQVRPRRPGPCATPG